MDRNEPKDITPMGPESSTFLLVQNEVKRIGESRPIAPEFLESMMPEHFRLFPIGLTRLDAARKKTVLGRCHSLVTSINRGFMKFSSLEAQQVHMSNWFTKMATFRSKPTGREAKEYYYISQIRARLGLHADDAFQEALTSYYLHYLPEKLESSEFEAAIESDDNAAVLREDINELFDGVQLSEEQLTNNMMSAQLHRTGRFNGLPSQAVLNNLSLEELAVRRELLDKRTRLIYFMAQAAAGNMLLGDLVQMHTMNESGERDANELFRQYQNKLFYDDVAAKQMLAEKISSAFLRYSKTDAGRPFEDAFGKLAEGSSKIGTHLREFVDSLITVYEQIGFELPDFLHVHVQEEAVDKQLSVEETFESKPSAEELLQTLHERINGLKDRITQVETDMEVSLSKRIREEAGFGNFQRSFKMGFKLDGHKFDAIGPDKAKQLFDTLVYLHQLRDNYIDLAEARQRFDDTKQAYGKLEAELVGLRAFARSHYLMPRFAIEWPSPFPFQSLVGEIKDRWSSLQGLILEKWPNYEGATAAQKIKELLFMQDMGETDGPGSRFLTKEEAFALTDGQLHEVIFPRNREVMEETVRQIVRRADLTERQLEDFQWERVRDLATLRDHVGGKMYHTMPGEKFLGEGIPHFILIIDTDEGDKIVFAEAPIRREATYCVSEKELGDAWIEAFKVSRRVDARHLGADYIIHSAEAPHGEKHVEKMIKKYEALKRRTH